jgi:hypothetical protein
MGLLRLRGVVNARRLPLRVMHLAEDVAAWLNDLAAGKTGQDVTPIGPQHSML